jgi:hypothetical protein
VRLPIQLQRAMAAEAEATREARAKVIAAEGEQKASKALRNAADTLTESSCSIQLRYLQTLQNIAVEKNSTIIFPVPIELMANFMKSGADKVSSKADSISRFKRFERENTATDFEIRDTPGMDDIFRKGINNPDDSLPAVSILR